MKVLKAQIEKYLQSANENGTQEDCALYESWLEQRAILEEVAEEDCYCGGYARFAKVIICRPCRARALVKG